MDYTISINKNWLLRHNITAREAAAELSERSELTVKVRARALSQTVGDLSTYAVMDEEADMRIRAAWERWIKEL